MNEQQQQRSADNEAAPNSLQTEMQRLRRAILRQGHAQDEFRSWFEGLVDRLISSETLGRTSSRGTTSSPDSPRSEDGLSQAQLRVLLELDQAVLHLIQLALNRDPGSNDQPRTLREGLDFMKIRVRNLQRSFGLEPIATVGRPFDDRIHTASGIAERADRPDGHVVEEILPGYRLNDRVLRPALVIVNHQPEPTLYDQPDFERGDP